MIAGLVARFAARGLTQRAAKAAAAATLAFAIVALLAALWGISAAFDWWDDRRAVTAATDAANAAFRKRQIEAERRAGAAKAERDAATAGDQRDLQEELNDASEAGDSGADAVWDGLWDQPAD